MISFFMTNFLIQYCSLQPLIPHYTKLVQLDSHSQPLTPPYFGELVHEILILPHGTVGGIISNGDMYLGFTLIPTLSPTH